MELLKRFWPYLLTLALGVVGGYLLKPDQYKVEYREHETEKLVVDQKLTEQEVERRMAEWTSKQQVKTVTQWVVKPDGSKTVTQTQEKNTETTSKEQEVKTVEKVVVQTVEKVVVRDVEKIVTPIPAQWQVGLGVATIPDFANPASTPLLVKASVARRIAGPFWVDVWLMGGSPVVGPPKPAGIGGGLDVLIQF